MRAVDIRAFEEVNEFETMKLSEKWNISKRNKRLRTRRGIQSKRTERRSVLSENFGSLYFVVVDVVFFF